jgi:hypothetical protein
MTKEVGGHRIRAAQARMPHDKEPAEQEKVSVSGFAKRVIARAERQGTLA